MSNFKKIFLIWGALSLLYSGAMLIFPRNEVLGSDIINRYIQSLLFIITLFVVFREKSFRNKAIFINFALFFSVCTALMVGPFIGNVFFSDEPYAFFFFWQYTAIAYIAFFSFAIVYLVVDLLFREFKIIAKYGIAITIVSTFFLFYFFPFFEDPFYLYSTEEIKQLKTLQEYVKPGDEVPTSAELASKVTLNTWRDGKSIGELFPEQNLKQIEYLQPYLDGDDTWMVIFTKPMYMRYIYMNVLVIGFILLFFGYQYKKDPPQGAYIDKIMFLFLLFSSMEILHFWEYMKSIEWNYYMEISNLGQYITIIVELLIGVFLALRLKFITSVQGEFYETELATNPRQISRWRDWVDNLVLSHFFDSKPIIGRFFQSTTESKQLDARLTANHEHRGIYGKRL